MKIYCCECKCEVEARLTNGVETYPHRPDLSHLPFWKCDKCANFVGCHYKSKDKRQPLGCIPTNEIKKVRRQIHRTLDPLWESGKYDRKQIYAIISKRIGKTYHTAEIRSLEEANEILKILQRL